MFLLMTVLDLCVLVSPAQGLQMKFGSVANSGAVIDSPLFLLNKIIKYEAPDGTLYKLYNITFS